MSGLSDQLRRRANCEWERDGLPQLLMGGATFFMLFGFMVPLLWRPDLQQSWYFVLPLLLLWFVILMAFKPIVLRLKSAIAFPRVGYALPPFLGEGDTPPPANTAEHYSLTGDTFARPAPEPDPRQARWIRLLTAAIPLCVVLDYSFRGPAAPYVMAFYLLVILLLIYRSSYGHVRWTLLASALGAVLLVYFGHLRPKQYVFFVPACFAAGLTLDGLVCLFLFLRRHPRASA